MRESPCSLINMISFPFHKNSSKRLGLFSFFLIAVLLFASCKRPETDLGGDLIPEGDLLSALQTDTVTLNVTVEREDSLRTDNLSTVMLGAYVDPVLGRTSASFYTQVHLSTSSPSFPSNAIVDSVILALVYDDRSYGKRGNQYVGVHRITEAISRDSNYYSNQLTFFDPFNLVVPGSETMHFDNSAIVVVGNDTVIPQLRIPLQQSFGQELLALPSSALASNEAFRQSFPGFYVSAGNFNTPSGVFNFDLVDAASRLIVYYHYDDNGQNVETRYDFNINTETAYYTYLRHRRAGTVLEPLDLYQQVSGNTTAFVQAGAGCRTKIELPHFDDFKNYDDISINRVQLIVPFEDSNKLPPQSGLFLVYKDMAGELRLIPDQVLGTIGGTADLVADHYIFNISVYFQRLLTGEIQSQGLYLVSQNAGVSVTRSVLNGPEHPERKMRMVVTFAHQ